MAKVPCHIPWALDGYGKGLHKQGQTHQFVRKNRQVKVYTTFPFMCGKMYI